MNVDRVQRCFDRCSEIRFQWGGVLTVCVVPPPGQVVALCFVLVLGSLAPCLPEFSLYSSSLSTSSPHTVKSAPLPSGDLYTTSQGMFHVANTKCMTCKTRLNVPARKQQWIFIFIQMHLKTERECFHCGYLMAFRHINTGNYPAR